MRGGRHGIQGAGAAGVVGGSVLALWGAAGLSSTPAPHRPRRLQPLRCLQPLGHHHGGTLHSLLQEPRVQRVAQLQRLPVSLGRDRRAGTPCSGHPVPTAHSSPPPLPAASPRCPRATCAAAMPTCSSTSWPARPPACSQPCFPGDPLCHPSEPALPGFGHSASPEQEGGEEETPPRWLQREAEDSQEQSPGKDIPALNCGGQLVSGQGSGSSGTF